MNLRSRDLEISLPRHSHVFAAEIAEMRGRQCA
jgi:hypothetical protein